MMRKLGLLVLFIFILSACAARQPSEQPVNTYIAEAAPTPQPVAVPLPTPTPPPEPPPEPTPLPWQVVYADMLWAYQHKAEKAYFLLYDFDLSGTPELLILCTDDEFYFYQESAYAFRDGALVAIQPWDDGIFSLALSASGQIWSPPDGSPGLIAYHSGPGWVYGRSFYYWRIILDGDKLVTDAVGSNRVIWSEVLEEYLKATAAGEDPEYPQDYREYLLNGESVTEEDFYRIFEYVREHDTWRYIYLYEITEDNIRRCVWEGFEPPAEPALPWQVVYANMLWAYKGEAERVFFVLYDFDLSGTPELLIMCLDENDDFYNEAAYAFRDGALVSIQPWDDHIFGLGMSANGRLWPPPDGAPGLIAYHSGPGWVYGRSFYYWRIILDGDRLVTDAVGSNRVIWSEVLEEFLRANYAGENPEYPEDYREFLINDERVTEDDLHRMFEHMIEHERWGYITVSDRHGFHPPEVTVDSIRRWVWEDFEPPAEPALPWQVVYANILWAYKQKAEYAYFLMFDFDWSGTPELLVLQLGGTIDDEIYEETAYAFRDGVPVSIQTWGRDLSLVEAGLASSMLVYPAPDGARGLVVYFQGVSSRLSGGTLYYTRVALDGDKLVIDAEGLSRVVWSEALEEYERAYFAGEDVERPEDYREFLINGERVTEEELNRMFEHDAPGYVANRRHFSPSVKVTEESIRQRVWADFTPPADFTPAPARP